MTRRNAPHLNSAGTPPALADSRKNTTRFSLRAASSCVTDFFRDVFVERRTIAVTMRCDELSRVTESLIIIIIIITRRALGGAHVPPIKVFRRVTVSVHETC